MIDIYFKDIDNFEIKSSDFYLNWLSQVVKKENKVIGWIQIIFCSDEYILKINNKFLNHDYYTDIITFDYTDGNELNGELFISVDRVKENAVLYNDSFGNELNRVIVHGIFHLCGYKDKTENESLLMRRKEDESLLLLK